MDNKEHCGPEHCIPGIGQHRARQVSTDQHRSTQLFTGQHRSSRSPQPYTDQHTPTTRRRPCSIRCQTPPKCCRACTARRRMCATFFRRCSMRCKRCTIRCRACHALSNVSYALQNEICVMRCGKEHVRRVAEHSLRVVEPAPHVSELVTHIATHAVETHVVEDVLRGIEYGMSDVEYATRTTRPYGPAQYET